MGEKLEFLAGEEWEIKELGDIYGNREAFMDWLDEQKFNKDSHFIKITVKIIAK